MGRHLTLSGLVLSLLAATAGRADDSIDLPSYLHFSGFGTLGLATSDNSHYALQRDQEDGKGISAVTSPLWPDSRLGLQMDAEITPELSATVQGVLRKDPPISFTDTVQWAFLKYEPFSWLQLRAGRMGTDSFMLSDLRNVGFTYPWVRPPVEFYALFPAYSYDGADALYRARLSDDWSLEIEGFYGVTRLTLTNIGLRPTDLKIPYFRGGNAILRDESWTFRLSGAVGRIANEIPGFDQVIAGLNVVSDRVPEAGAAASALNLKGPVHFYSAGIGYDDGLWVGQTEYGLTTCDCDLLLGNNAAYAMAGRRFGEWMPFLSYSRVWQNDEPLHYSTALPFPQLQQLFGAANQIVGSSNLDQDDRTIGLRWSATDHTDVKIQFDNYHVRNFSVIWSSLTDAPPTGRGTVNLFSASIDVIF